MANTTWAKMGGWLWSLAMTDCWRKNVQWKEAECLRGHRIPDEHCGCGIWAFFNPEIMEQVFGAPAARAALGSSESYEEVTGIIVADGDIAIHDKGFRAQYAKVAAILEDPSPPPSRR